MKPANLFAKSPDPQPEEFMESLMTTAATRIERIVSHGHASPPGFWYDQDLHEWVVVLQGRARLTMAGRDRPLELGRGDYVNIPAHVRHRVEWTDPDRDTVWLAVFYR
ncbi:MAG: cupin domain-containing protein [Gammaproteobacteria bacterium]|nr:cupin domain-containing protein [Gammaproteobacteria bacterium]MCP5425122.1 cupin domain-containing protein [Gammaproteobacteria bacterium]MCP5459809.1 cupin domain-containing protein [Gammaproteobacteria bacterium]